MMYPPPESPRTVRVRWVLLGLLCAITWLLVLAHG